ncbi:hypothetical protein FACS1894110_09870 [Spirochaetia bacterium]|nr:hypothetical protein FACS1894110_09870 [Spirochaetia bacterium]
MTAFKIKAAIDQLLIDNAHGEFQVFTSSLRVDDAVNVEKCPHVSTLLSGGNFSNNRRLNGPRTANNTLRIIFVAGAKAEIDLGVMDDPLSTQDQKSEAMLAAECAEPIARRKAEKLCSRLYKIIMSRSNKELAGENPNLTVTGYEIGEFPKKGSIVQSGGVINATFDTTEYAGGLEPVPATAPIADIKLDLSADISGETIDSALQGVIIEGAE